MILNDRKIRILEAIINDYIATAEPIGSRTIAKKYDLGISSATIRNEMSDLEELGLIVQPHTSAGRVPSDKGYRLYVDQLMHSRELTRDESIYLKNLISENIGHIEYLMKQTAKALSLMTNYTTVVTEPKSTRVKIKHLQLVPVDERSVVAVVVTENKVVKNHMIRVAKVPDMEELNKISNILNLWLSKHSLDEMDKTVVEEILRQSEGNEELVAAVFKAIVSTVKEEEDIQLYTSGVKNILGFPEFSDIEKAKSIFQTLEEKEMLITLLGQNETPAEKIHILIGGENNMEQMKDCSIVRANYKFGNNSYGTIGIIGPTRMNYSQTVSILNGIVKNINDVIKALSGGGENGG